MMLRPRPLLSPARVFGSLAESLVQKKGSLRLRLHGPISVVGLPLLFLF